MSKRIDEPDETMYRKSIDALQNLASDLKFDETCACDACLFQVDFRTKVLELSKWAADWSKRLDEHDEYDE